MTWIFETKTLFLGKKLGFATWVLWLKNLPSFMEHLPQFIGKVLGWFGGRMEWVCSEWSEPRNMLKSETCGISVACLWLGFPSTQAIRTLASNRRDKYGLIRVVVVFSFFHFWKKFLLTLASCDLDYIHKCLHSYHTMLCNMSWVKKDKNIWV